MDGGSREGSVDGETIDRGEVEAEGGGGGNLVAATAAVVGAQRATGERRLVSVSERRAFLEKDTVTSLVTLYGGAMVQHLGGTPAAKFALSMIQQFVWAKSSATTKDSQLRKFETFCVQEGRGMPPGEIDLVCYVAYLSWEGRVRAGNMRGYLSAVRRFCVQQKMEPLPPTPTESDLLMDSLKAADRLDSEMPVKEQWGRAGISAADTMAVLLYEKGEESFMLKKMKAMWIVMFCFSFRGGTTAALWPMDFEFTDDFTMSVKPDVLKRTGTDCTNNPGARPYAVPVDTSEGNNAVLFLREFVNEYVAKFGQRAFMFSADPEKVSGTDYISTAIVAMADYAGIIAPQGMKLSSHSPRRGMLSEFVLQHPRPDDIVIAIRMDWSPMANLKTVYFCRNVIRSEASAVLVLGALKVQVEESC